MRVLGIIFAAFSLTGCITREELLQQDRLTCTEIGFQADSEKYQSCLVQLQAARHGHYR